MRIAAFIPARGGSKGIPRKNIKLMNGKPLIWYAINNALSVDAITDVIVSTDDEEIADVSRMCGARVIMRPDELGQDAVTLDPVIHHAVGVLEEDGNGSVDIVITMQPTSPVLTAATLKAALDDFIEHNRETVISAVNKPHLAWTLDAEGNTVPLYEKRLNRQQLPPRYAETGAFVITRREFVKSDSRLGPHPSVYEIPERESVDIDTKEDWLICEQQLSSKRILILAEGFKRIGTGHIFRTILLTNALFEHEVLIVTTKRSDTGIERLEKSNLKFRVIDDIGAITEVIKDYKPDIVINDILDTEADFIKAEKALVDRVINFEDKGPGSEFADAVINSLYAPENLPGNFFWGEKYYCLRDDFMLHEPREFSEKVENVLVAFGGTDPSGFTYRMLEVINTLPKECDMLFTIILGVGFEQTEEFKTLLGQIKADGNRHVEVLQDVSSMAKYMNRADMAFSSQGRTMYELASQRVPTIILSHSDREYTHEFGFMKNGFINLGNGNNISNDTISETLQWLMHSPQIRKQMYDQMGAKHLEKGIERVKAVILGED